MWLTCLCVCDGTKNDLKNIEMLRNDQPLKMAEKLESLKWQQRYYSMELPLFGDTKIRNSSD